MEPVSRQQAQVFQLVRLDILALALVENVEEHRERLDPIGYDDSIAAGAPPTSPRDALLDQAAAQICVHEATRGAADRFAQALVVDTFAAREPNKPSGLEDTHAHSMIQIIIVP